MNIPNRSSQKPIFKTVLIILIILYIINLILISRSRAVGYEDSIYSNLPVIVWIFLLLSIMCGIILMTIPAEKDSYWLAGLVIILSNNMLVALLPVLKGYFFYGNADPLSHIGWIKDIISEGSFGKDNLYPITHVLFSEIALFSNIPPVRLYGYMPAFFNMLFVLSIYLFAKTILINKKQVLVATASGGILFIGGYHAQIVPNGIADFCYPLFMAVFYARNIKKSFNYNILLLILIIFFPFLHPLTSFSLIFTIILFKLSFRVMEIQDVEQKEIFSQIRQKATIPLQIVLIVFVAWISTFWVWGQTMRNIFNFLLGDVTTSPINAMANTIDKINLSGIDFLELVLKLYGHNLIFFIISVISSLIIIKEVLRNRKYEYQNNFSLAVIFIGFIIFLLLFLFVPMTFGNLRTMTYPIIISIILVSFFIHESFIKSKFNKKKYIFPLAISIILIIPFSVGIFNIFDSPYILKSNQQITYAEIDGYIWTFNKKNPEISVSTIMSVQPYRFVDVLWGVKARNDRSDVKSYGAGPEAKIPDHFNYTNYNTVGSSYSYDSYIFFSEHDKRLYTGVWKSVGRFNSTDFERISFDPTMKKIYSNGGFDTWFVKSLK